MRATRTVAYCFQILTPSASGRAAEAAKFFAPQPKIGDTFLVYIGMGRPYRHVHPGGAFFEITTRAVHSRYLLPTGEHFRSLAIGIMARAKERYPVELYAFGGVSNHMHWLLGVSDVDKLAGFVGYVKSNMAREAGRIVDWKEKFWGRRYRAIEISSEEAALVDRLRYVASHGVKENLVLRCRDWPGLQCIDALTQGKPLEGIWQDRTLEYEANRRGKDIDPEAFIERYTLELDPLPCWRHLPKEEIRRRISEIVTEIDAESARQVVLNGRTPLGAAAIRKQQPHDWPQQTKKSPAPRVHAASKAKRKQMIAAYRLFDATYREASARFRAGELSVEFPPGCFPPAPPFVPSDAGQPSSRAGPVWVPG